ncbi:ParB/RepB/Spo0J family partition protein [Shimia aestuarii]|uniref:ParB/RepB/Spo0J family partition protein n=1 Tax=Shimia aestuarii TaxID=254406 RepID=A0A1I4TSP6_9RHOB|nr:ParB N-terminal domain-containing protein [Shimia aestuarii]SFM79738.1 ParB/RepB/Spo0J family partition protein [Shimia aestuarii]
MAKRKRLSPANPVFLSEEAPVPLSPHHAPPIADVAGEASARAALEEVTDTLTRARTEGRMVIPLPLSSIDMGYLVRDRLHVDDAEMVALIESLRARGQQTPIEVAPLDHDRYGLISGWRRCTALARLAEETGEDATVLAFVRQPDQSAAAYLAMVEENEIRVGLSFYERARIVACCVENRVYSSQKQALNALFASASRAKRSKIKSFVAIVEALDGSLRFPQSIGERLGLQLAKSLEADAGLATRLRRILEQGAPESPEAEQALITAALKPQKKSLTRENAAQELAPGLEMKAGRNSLTLKGTALNADLQARLVAWLKSELG